MALIDTHAAGTLREMRESRGLSPEALAHEIRQAAMRNGWGQRGTVDAYTIRRIEKHGHVPGVRVAFVLANFYGLQPADIWNPRHARDTRTGVRA